jgi:hypothetical protein
VGRKSGGSFRDNYEKIRWRPVGEVKIRHRSVDGKAPVKIVHDKKMLVVLNREQFDGKGVM